MIPWRLSRRWAVRARRGLALGLDTLLPRQCPGCGVELAPGRWICEECRRKFRAAPPGWLRLTLRVQRRPSGDREAGYGAAGPGPDDFPAAAAFWMEPPLAEVVHAFKYGGRRDLAAPLGRLLARGVHPPVSALATAVPLHPTRRRERGYNQAELLAREAGARWGIPWVEGTLVRTRATRPQARLAESQRAANVSGVFRVVEPRWVRGRTWVLVDDVMTTGSTLLEAAEALRRAGAKHVAAVALALA